MRQEQNHPLTAAVGSNLLSGCFECAGQVNEWHWSIMQFSLLLKSLIDLNASQSFFFFHLEKKKFNSKKHYNVMWRKVLQSFMSFYFRIRLQHWVQCSIIVSAVFFHLVKALIHHVTVGCSRWKLTTVGQKRWTFSSSIQDGMKLSEIAPIQDTGDWRQAVKLVSVRKWGCCCCYDPLHWVNTTSSAPFFNKVKKKLIFFIILKMDNPSWSCFLNFCSHMSSYDLSGLPCMIWNPFRFISYTMNLQESRSLRYSFYSLTTQLSFLGGLR